MNHNRRVGGLVHFPVRSHVIGVTVREKNFSLYEAYSASEAFLTGTFGAQTPVAEIDGKAIGSAARPVMERIREEYKQMLAEDITSQRGSATV